MISQSRRNTLQEIPEDKSRESRSNTTPSDPGVPIMTPATVPREIKKKKNKSFRAIIKQYDEEGNLIREKKVKIDEFGNPIRKGKVKSSKSKLTDMENSVQFPFDQSNSNGSLSYGDFETKKGPTFEMPSRAGTFVQANNYNIPYDATGATFAGRQNQSFSGEDSVSTMGNMSAAEVVRRNYFSEFRFAQPQQSSNQNSGQPLHHNGNQRLQSDRGHQPVQYDGRVIGTGEFHNQRYHSKPPPRNTNDVDKFKIFAQDFDGHRPRQGQGANVDKIRMLADSFEVTAGQFAQAPGNTKPPGYTPGSYGAQQGYVQRFHQPTHAPAPVWYPPVPVAYPPAPAITSAAARNAEIEAKAETHALVVQYMISSGVDPVIAEQMACEFEAAQEQGMDSYAAGTAVAPTREKSHEIDKFDIFSQGDEARVPNAIVGALAPGSAMAIWQEQGKADLHRLPYDKPTLSTWAATSSQTPPGHEYVMPTTPTTAHDDPPTMHALLIQYLISVGTDPQVAGRMADEFNERQSHGGGGSEVAAPRQDVPIVASAFGNSTIGENERIQSFQRKQLEAMNGGYEPRQSTLGSGASVAVAGHGPMSQFMPAGRRPPRADRPGAVEMEGRAFGAPRRPTVAQQQIGEVDEEIDRLDTGANNEHGPYIEAVPVTGKDPYSNDDLEIVYAESATFGIKHILNERPVRRLLSLVCLIIVGVIIGAVVVAVKSSKKGMPEVISVTLSPTGTPTSAPSFIGDDIERAAGAISGFGSVLATESPQRRAVGWLSSKDKFDTQGIGVLFSQRYILTVFYFATKGELWLEQDKWLSPTLHVCDWSVSIVCGADVTQRRVVTGLDLTRNGLSGYIPNEVGLIDGLTLLRLARNSIKGTIPESISKLTGLSLLDLSVNELSGTVPSGIGKLENLVSLELYENTLTGQIPSSTYDLGQLKKLDLSKNELTGPLSQDVDKLQSLGTLNVRDNDMNGRIPAFTLLTTLDFIYLDYNQFSGPLPDLGKDVIGRLEFSFSHNRISGRLPGLADINATEFEGAEFRIQRIDLAYNQLTGTIDPLISLVPSFRYLDLSGNDFTGPIPAQVSVAGWQGLQYFGAANNQFTGTFPLGFASSLTSLDISDNRLTGGIPLDLYSTFPKLELLVASNNPLGGRLSGLLGNLVALRDLHVNNCSLTGALPDNVRGLQNLEYLALQDNGITGLVPSSLGSLPLLRELELQNNKLTATLPSEIGSLELLNLLNVANNNLSGSLPSSLMFLAKLKELDVSGNLFTGEVPHGVCDNLEVTRAMVGCDLECSCCLTENETNVCGGIFYRGAS